MSNLKPIIDVARDIGIPDKFLNQYRNYASKVSLGAVSSLTENRDHSKVILVTAMTPTPLGEGKTVTAIAISMALNRLNYKSVVLLRQPSLGPIFGIKGGATGGGHCTVEPSTEINMRFTGDIDAVSASHNLLSAMLDNHIFHGNELGIEKSTITWKRSMDIEDRALRKITVGLSGGAQQNSHSREDGFLITAASEVMATLCLAKDYRDLEARLGRIIVGFSARGLPVTAKDLKSSGAMSALLKDAFEPNLVQTCEGTPALIHGGPFGNLATGTCSLVSIQLGRSLSDYCVVEAGFGSDLGAEKFVDIVARLGEFNVDAAVIVVSLRALKYHSQVQSEIVRAIHVVSSGSSPTVQAISTLTGGIENMMKHVENVRGFGIEPVVAINRFPEDSDEEIAQVVDVCKSLKIRYAVSTGFEKGSEGALDLAELVTEAAACGKRSRPIYLSDEKTEVKLDRIVDRIYGGDGVDYDGSGYEDLRVISKFGFDELPLCVAKTSASLSDDPTKLGRPRGFRVHVDAIRIAASAGFNIVYMGNVMVMPGLPSHPSAERISLTNEGQIVGVQ
jgi:formate--tetrahydrofolate ligase